MSKDIELEDKPSEVAQDGVESKTDDDENIITSSDSDIEDKPSEVSKDEVEIRIETKTDGDGGISSRKKEKPRPPRLPPAPPKAPPPKRTDLTEPQHEENPKKFSISTISSILGFVGCVFTSIFGIVSSCAWLLQFCCLGAMFILGTMFGILLLSTGKGFSSSSASILGPTGDETLAERTYNLVEDLLFSVGHESITASDPPTLIVQITIDQLRADEVMKLRKRFIPDGGFDRLFKNGVFYRNAHYRHARLVTPAGHSTLLTGGVGFSHGIIAHYFLDPNLQKIVAATENTNYTEVSGLENITNSAPSYLTSSTTGDELRLFTIKSKMFSVSSKDYVANLQCGHMGKAFWYSAKTGRYISSTYHYDEYPQYINDWNDERLVDSYEDEHWELSYEQQLYHYQDRSFVYDGYLGKDFPKPLYVEDFDGNRHKYYKTLLQTPAGDMMMWDFVKNLITEEELGQRKDEEREDGDIIDMLAISFSSLDKIGHANGPNSLEYEDMIYKLDELLNEVLDFLDDHIGLENCLIALSADHGVALSWAHAKDIGYSTAGELYTAPLEPILEAYLNETVFGNALTSPVVLGFSMANLYFHKDVILAHGKTVDEVAEASKEWLLDTQDTIYYAFTRKNIMEGNVPDTLIGRSVMLQFHPERSGDVVIIIKQNVYLFTSWIPSVAAHGTAWSYDTYVPIFFMGQDIPQGLVVDRRVTPEDIAPTITSYFGINAPSGCLGDPLVEVLKNHDVNPFEN